MLNRKNASCLNLTVLDFPDGPVFESLPAKSGDTGLILGTGRFHVLQGSRTTEACMLDSVLDLQRSNGQHGWNLNPVCLMPRTMLLSNLTLFKAKQPRLWTSSRSPGLVENSHS